MAERRRGGFGAQVATLASVLALSQLAPAVLLAVSLAGWTSAHEGGRVVASTRLIDQMGPAGVASRARPASRASALWERAPAREAPARALSILDPSPALEPPPSRDPVPRYGPPPPPAPAPRPMAVPPPPLRVPPSVLRARATIVALLEAAAAEFGQDKEALLRVAYCESRFDPQAVGPFGEIGILQFFPSTFAKWGKTLGYTAADIWDVRAQARVAAYMWSRNQKSQWVCR